MPNTLTISIRDKDGYDLAGFMDALEQGLYSMDGGTLELSGDNDWEAGFTSQSSPQPLRLFGTTNDGEQQAEGFVIHEEPTASQGWDEGVAAVVATYSSPQPLGVLYEGLTLLHDTLLGDTRFDIRGNRGDDAATGSDFGDQFRMGRGDDSVAGGDGNDVLIGGRGNDLLIGGADDDLLRGGRGNDMLIAGTGDDTLKGGGGNDVMVIQGGTNKVRGGAGNDLMNVEIGMAATAPAEGYTRVSWLDFNAAKDVLVLTDLFVSPDTIDPAHETLADIENGTIDDFQWRETKRGVEIQAGNASIMLRGVDADEIDLDHLLFTQATAQETVTLFDSTHGGGTLGTPPGGDPYLVYTFEDFTTVFDGTNSFNTYGGDILGFISFGDGAGV